MLRDLSEGLSGEIDRAREQIFQLAGEHFDLNSPRQLGDILFDKLKIDPDAAALQGPNSTRPRSRSCDGWRINMKSWNR